MQHHFRAIIRALKPCAFEMQPVIFSEAKDKTERLNSLPGNLHLRIHGSDYRMLLFWQQIAKYAKHSVLFLDKVRCMSH